MQQSFLAWLLESKQSVSNQLNNAIAAHEARFDVVPTAIHISAVTRPRVEELHGLTVVLDERVPPNVIWLVRGES